jgi:hypothetical protein
MFVTFFLVFLSLFVFGQSPYTLKFVRYVFIHIYKASSTDTVASLNTMTWRTTVVFFLLLAEET